jgi:hypothetical protein
VLRLCPRGSRYALVACATPLRLGLCLCGSGFALAARATPLQLGLCPCGLCYALPAWALPSRLTLHTCGSALPALPSRLALRACGWGCSGSSSSGSNGGQCLPLRLGFSHFALAAHATPSRLGFAHTQQSNSKAAATKGALAALPLICRSGSSWWQQCWQLW